MRFTRFPSSSGKILPQLVLRSRAEEEWERFAAPPSTWDQRLRARGLLPGEKQQSDAARSERIVRQIVTSGPSYLDGILRYPLYEPGSQHVVPSDEELVEAEVNELTASAERLALLASQLSKLKAEPAQIAAVVADLEATIFDTTVWESEYASPRNTVRSVLEKLYPAVSSRLLDFAIWKDPWALTAFDAPPYAALPEAIREGRDDRFLALRDRSVDWQLLANPELPEEQLWRIVVRRAKHFHDFGYLMTQNADDHRRIGQLLADDDSALETFITMRLGDVLWAALATRAAAPKPPSRHLLNLVLDAVASSPCEMVAADGDFVDYLDHHLGDEASRRMATASEILAVRVARACRRTTSDRSLMEQLAGHRNVDVRRGLLLDPEEFWELSPATQQLYREVVIPKLTRDRSPHIRKVIAALRTAIRSQEHAGSPQTAVSAVPAQLEVGIPVTPVLDRLSEALASGGPTSAGRAFVIQGNQEGLLHAIDEEFQLTFGRDEHRKLTCGGYIEENDQTIAILLEPSRPWSALFLMNGWKEA